MRLLITGATGKVGMAFLNHFFSGEAFSLAQVRALCHRRLLEPNPRLEVFQGSISNRTVVREAMKGVTHVLHLATVKETPDQVMNVAVKGMFWLLEEARESPDFEQFIFVGGDASVGHFFYPYEEPITEETPHKAYPGCYALSKVLEEVMLMQSWHQYDLNGCCLRAPWIMEKDDFKYSLAFGPEQFGGPRWSSYFSEKHVKKFRDQGIIPIMLDPDCRPVKRNIIHVDDVVSAIVTAINHPGARQQLFNIAMDQPLDYQKMADYLKKHRGLKSVNVPTKFYSTWLDNSKIRKELGWQPAYNMKKLIDAAWEYERDPDDPRKVWYPG